LLTCGGVMQTRYLSSLGCLWFDRKEQEDRRLVAERIKAHIGDVRNARLLIFPEGVWGGGG
jgi:glycerol-3-phosphate O-acyltransferase 3/4